MYVLFNLVPIVGAIIIGAVMAPKAGPAKGKMWLGLGMIVASAALSLIWQALLVVPWMHTVMWDAAGGRAYMMMGSGISLINTVLLLLGIYFLCAAVVMGRTATTYLDPSRPGAPPSTHPSGGYQGTGYPPAGDQPDTRPPSGAGSNPYV